MTANCGYPHFELLPNVSNESIPRVVGYNDDLPFREGTIISFSCPPGLALIRSSSATCTSNGEWEPDLRTVICDSSGNNSVLPANSTKTNTTACMCIVHIAIILLL